MPDPNCTPGRPGRISGKYGRLSAQDGINALAIRQNGVVELAQLVELGLTASAVHKRSASGRLYRIHQGVYALVPPSQLSRDGRFMAAVLACGPGAALSHRSAAALHELRRTERSRIDVIVPGRTSRAHAGVDVHRSNTLTGADVTHVNAIPCTTIARTLVDLAEVIGERGLERAYDQADTIEAVDLRALEDQLARNRHRRAAPRVRAVLQRHTAGSTLTESELEEAFLAFCRSVDIAAPELQVWIAPDDGEPAVRADFLWRPQTLIVETDGRKRHHSQRAFETDRRRDQRLTLAGWRVVRITWRQIHDEPARIARLIIGLLAAG